MYSAAVTAWREVHDVVKATQGLAALLKESMIPRVTEGAKLTGHTLNFTQQPGSAAALAAALVSRNDVAANNMQVGAIYISIICISFIYVNSGGSDNKTRQAERKLHFDVQRQYVITKRKAELPQMSFPITVIRPRC